MYCRTQQDLKCIRCKLDWKSWHTSDHSGRPTVPRELDESHQEHLHTSPQSLSQTLGVFWYTTGPQMHSVQARLEKLAHVRSFGTSNSTARARRVAPRKPPHFSAVAASGTWCILGHNRTSNAFVACSTGATNSTARARRVAPRTSPLGTSNAAQQDDEPHHKHLRTSD